MKPRRKEGETERKKELIRRTISLPGDVDQMAEERMKEERRSRSSYIVSLIMKDQGQPAGSEAA